MSEYEDSELELDRKETVVRKSLIRDDTPSKWIQKGTKRDL
jgi:hypothetical protein